MSKEWTRKSDYQPTPTGVEERKNEVPVICIEKPVLINAEPEIVNVEEPEAPTPSLDEGLGAIKLALIELDLLAEMLKEEFEDLETRLDNATARRDSVINAREALNKVIEMEAGKGLITR